ncbi:MAG: hypothetical protein AABZ06_14450 [Bdellovibrionota bacterium]
MSPSYSRIVQIPAKNAMELYEAVSRDIENFINKISVGHVEISKDPSKKEVQLSSSMFSAVLSCQEAQINIDCRLSLFAAPFRRKIDEGIDKWLRRTFNI